VNVASTQDLAARRIGDRQMLQTFFEMSPVPPNSDYRPYLDQHAARARFLGGAATNLMLFGLMRLPLAGLLGHVADGGDAAPTTQITFSPTQPQTWSIGMAMTVRDYFLTGSFVPHGRPISARTREAAVQLQRMYAAGANRSDPNRRNYIFHTGASTMAYLCPADCAAIWKALESGPDTQTLSPMERQYAALFQAIGRRDARGMSESARVILETEKDSTVGRFRYILAVGMIGDLAQGNEAAAARLWAQHRAVAFASGQPDLLFRYLVAKSVGNGRNETIHVGIPGTR